MALIIFYCPKRSMPNIAFQVMQALPVQQPLGLVNMVSAFRISRRDGR